MNLPNAPVHAPQTRQTIVRLLSSMASAKEISQYVKRFAQLDAARFAVVKVGGAVLRDDLDALTTGPVRSLTTRCRQRGSRSARSQACASRRPKRWRWCAACSRRRT